MITSWYEVHCFSREYRKDSCQFGFFLTCQHPWHIDLVKIKISTCQLVRCTLKRFFTIWYYRQNSMFPRIQFYHTNCWCNLPLICLSIKQNLLSPYDSTLCTLLGWNAFHNLHAIWNIRVWNIRVSTQKKEKNKGHQYLIWKF